MRSLGKTCVCFEAKQAGVGGINSWSKLPLEPYLLKAGPREFTYSISPVIE